MSSKGPKRARAVSAQRLAQQRAAERRRRALVAGAIAAAVLLVSVVIGIAVYTSRDKAPDEFAIPKGATATGVVVGDPKAEVTVDLYVDYLCPICKEFEDQAGAELDKLVADGTIKIDYHPVAYLDRLSSTEYSTRASAAAGAAIEAGVFDEFTKQLFANQPPEGGAGLSNDTLIELGAKAGASSPEFAQAVRDQKFAGWTAALTEAASKRGVSGTPTVLVDGQRVENLSVDALKAAIAKNTPQ